jgi:hypothetical protein
MASAVLKGILRGVGILLFTAFLGVSSGACGVSEAEGTIEEAGQVEQAAVAPGDPEPVDGCKGRSYANCGNGTCGKNNIACAWAGGDGCQCPEVSQPVPGPTEPLAQSQAPCH